MKSKLLKINYLRLIIWRSLVQAQAGPQIKKAVFPKGIQPFLFVNSPGINPLL